MSEERSAVPYALGQATKQVGEIVFNLRERAEKAEAKVKKAIEWLSLEIKDYPLDSSPPKTFVEAHKSDCDHYADMTCTCGLDELLDTLKEKKGK